MSQCDQCGVVDPDDIHTCGAKAGVVQEPLFWYRSRSDGICEGPIHNDRIGDVRRMSGVWIPLVPATAQTAQKQWVDLIGTEKLACLAAGNANGWIGVLEATQAKLREKNAARPSEPLTQKQRSAIHETTSKMRFHDAINYAINQTELAHGIAKGTK